MTDAPQPMAGSLEAKIIHACRVHTKCALTCLQRKVEDLGELASFGTPSAELEPLAKPDFLSRVKHLFRKGVT